MKEFKLIIFDLDGTLVDSYPAIIASTNFTLRKIGLPQQHNNAICRAVGWGDWSLIASFVDKKRIKRALSIYRQHHKASLKKKSFLMPHARRVLGYLKKHGYKIAIASNRPRRFLNIIIQHLNIGTVFDCILCKDQIAYGKPHPNMINRIVARLKVKKNHVLYVGDMVVDVVTGKRAHVATCAITTGSSSLKELQKSHPDFLYKSLAPLLSVV